MENARVANSAMNGQVLRYVLVKSQETVKKLQPYFHFAAALPKELGQPKEGEQPTAFIIPLHGRAGNPVDRYRYRHRRKDNESECLHLRHRFLYHRKCGI